MNQQASREILWNITHPMNSIVMYALCGLAMAIGFAGVWRRSELWLSGKDDEAHTGNYLHRFLDMFENALLQRKVVREKVPAIAHSLIFFGFLVLLFTTTMVMLDHDFGIRIYQGDFYLITTLFSDVFGLGVIIGCGIMAYRRYSSRLDQLHSSAADFILLGSLILLCVQGFLLEGLRIHVTNDAWAAYSPVGLGIARFFWFLSPDAASYLHYAIWWFHTLTVFTCVAAVPYTKYFHAFVSAVNLYFQGNGRPKGALKNPGDIEQLMEDGDEFSLGLGSIKDYTWKQLLDLDSCTSCGRCQDVCPAYNSGKMLSPKWMILDTRNHMLALHAKNDTSALPKPFVSLDSNLTNLYLRSAGLSKAADGEHLDMERSFRAGNEMVQQALLKPGASEDQRIAGDVMHQDVFWSCTTCMACVEACPVGINHVEQITENRRNMVLMEGEIPSEAQQTLRALENRGNPYGPAEDRMNWAADLDVPVIQEGDEVDYLYWIGCVSAFDPRKQKIARAMVNILNASGVSYGILGAAESCTGDPARRLGEENLFQMLAKQNIATLKSVTYKKLVANCPHCFNTIKNEYPQFDYSGEGLPEVIHHSQLLQQLIEENKITLKDEALSYTFHDPCYLGRYNDEYEAPRESLKGIKSLKILEMDKSKEKGMCCGAGGGHFWMDMKDGERVNVLRTNQAAETGSNKIATACPFCMQMMEDGVKLTGRESAMIVRDISEIIEENLILPSDNAH